MQPVNRWWIAVAGVCMQMALGAGYAWSVFRNPLIKEYGWTISQVGLPFTISWFMLGALSFVGGLWMNRSGPRVVAMTASVLWGGGVALASFGGHNLWWLYLSYGVIGGMGLGFGYIVPVSTVVKWFPDHRGLVTGLAVGGFGAGSLIAAPVAGKLIASIGVMPTFLYMGIAYAVVALIGASFMRVPPAGWTPPGWVPNAAQAAQRSDKEYSLGEAVKTWQWWALCALLSINTIDGISIVAQASPLFQEISHVSAATAASFVGIISVANGIGRLFWAYVSDITSRKSAFFAMFVIQAGLFWAYHLISEPTLLLIVTFAILMCYGGGYGITPVFAADYFGAKNVGPIFGLMLLPWAFPAAFGTLFISKMREVTGGYTQALYLIAGMMTVAMVLPLLVSPPHGHKNSAAAPVPSPSTGD